MFTSPQDIIIALSYVSFNLALIPSIKSKSKPHLKTSLVTAFTNVVIAVTQLSLGLYISALSTAINASLWFLLAYQRKMKK